jgi:hypothetical protein
LSADTWGVDFFFTLNHHGSFRAYLQRGMSLLILAAIARFVVQARNDRWLHGGIDDLFRNLSFEALRVSGRAGARIPGRRNLGAMVCK